MFSLVEVFSIEKWRASLNGWNGWFFYFCGRMYITRHYFFGTDKHKLSAWWVEPPYITSECNRQSTNDFTVLVSSTELRFGLKKCLFWGQYFHVLYS